MPDPIVPAPPAASHGLPWHAEVEDAVAEIAAARAEHGDTFALSHGRDHYLFTFSPDGVESFYALKEEVASKGVADYLMLRRKLPDGIFDGRRVLPGTLFRKGDVAVYLTNLEAALDASIAELGESGEADVFDLTRRLGHRLGLASWAGTAAATGDGFERLVAAFDVLDGSDAFVHPDTMAAVAASGKVAESAALAEVVDVVGPLPTDDGLFGRVHDAWADEPDEEARRRGIALDVALLHIASMSNLHAALGWALVDLLAHPEAVTRLRAGDGEYAGRCALESTRLAQRSIMARSVLAPVSFSDGDDDLPGAARVDHRDAAPPAQHLRRPRPRHLGPRPLGPPPPAPRRRPRLPPARDGVRPRPPHLPRPAVLARRDVDGDAAARRRLRPDAPLGAAPHARAGPDRRGGPRVRARAGRLRATARWLTSSPGRWPRTVVEELPLGSVSKPGDVHGFAREAFRRLSGGSRTVPLGSLSNLVRSMASQGKPSGSAVSRRSQSDLLNHRVVTCTRPPVRPAPTVVEELPLGSVSKPGDVHGFARELFRLSGFETVAERPPQPPWGEVHPATCDRPAPTVVEELPLGSVSKPGEVHGFAREPSGSAVSRRSQSDLLNHRVVRSMASRGKPSGSAVSRRSQSDLLNHRLVTSMASRGKPSGSAVSRRSQSDLLNHQGEARPPQPPW